MDNSMLRIYHEYYREDYETGVRFGVAFGLYSVITFLGIVFLPFYRLPSHHGCTIAIFRVVIGSLLAIVSFALFLSAIKVKKREQLELIRTE